jgi:hypothetical protein
MVVGGKMRVHFAGLVRMAILLARSRGRMRAFLRLLSVMQ